MSQRLLNVSFFERDAVVCSWRTDETLVCVYAYKVLQTSAGFVMAGQILQHTRQMQVVAHISPPMQLHPTNPSDGFVSEAEAVMLMAQHASMKVLELSVIHSKQGETVVLASLEEVYDAATLP